MKLVNLDQHGVAWHKWRSAGIGGSDACAVMGTVGWKTRDQLIHQKATNDTTDVENFAMRRGKELEPEARELYQQLTGLVSPPVCVQHDTMPWLRASLDGWNEEHGIVLEIKCPYSPWPHRMALYGHKVPHYYWPQVQHQLLVTGAKKLHYFSYTDDPSFPAHERYALVEVDPDEEYQIRLLATELQAMREIRAEESLFEKAR